METPETPENINSETTYAFRETPETETETPETVKWLHGFISGVKKEFR
jgi:hypothetical protein